jgi:hypothetical protein
VEHFFRYDDTQFAPPLDEFENPVGPGRVVVQLTEFPVIRRTKCGAWVDNFGTPRFVLLSARKQFACPTKEDAKVSFLARKKAQARIYAARLRATNEAIALADRLP